MSRSIRLGYLTSISSILVASTALAQSPYLKPDDTWISIDGTVEQVSADSFELDYGPGMITVEMDDRDRDAEGYKLMKGDRVSVSGMIDDDFYEMTKIEAASVYVEELGTHFYASPIDEEDTILEVGPIEVSNTTLQGKVTSVNADAEKFTLGSGQGKVTIEVDEMPYNPLDDEGYQKISKGDVVSVTGNLDKELIDGWVFDAERVTTLRYKGTEKS